MTLYVPPAYAEHDRAKALGLMRDHPFATLVVVHEGAPLISHVPILVDEAASELALLFHLARANPMTQALVQGALATAIFHGAHAYISPTWMEGAGHVPTWNYSAVHVTGAVHVHDGATALHDLAQLAAHFEEGDDPWTMERLTPERRNHLMAHLQAFHLIADKIEAKAKLSQNQSAASRAGIIKGLEARGEAAMVQAMGEVD